MRRFVLTSVFLLQVVATSATEVRAQAVQRSTERQGATASQPPVVDHRGTVPPPDDGGHALLRVPDPQSQAWLLLAQGTRSFHADSLAGPPPSPISDQGKGWIILGILVLVVLGLVFVPKAIYD